MRQPIIAIVTVLVFVALVAEAAAQAAQPGGNVINVRGGRSYGGGGGFPYGGGGWGGFGYGGYGMPGTAASSEAFGMASMIAASGYANMQDSIAAKNYEEARTTDFNNRVLWTNSYYQMRQAHRAYIADHSRLSMDEITKIAQDAAPKRLDPTQFDPTSGKIAWPLILQDVRYAEVCEELENLYKNRATASGFIGAENYQNINRACNRLMDLLKANIDEYRTNDFEKARHFIDSLRYEAHFPTS